MINPYADVNWRPDRSGLRAFGRSLVIGFPVVAVVLAAAARVFTGAWNWEWPLVVGTTGVALGLAFLLVPRVARPFYVVWYGVACAIGFVVSNLLLVVVFYGLFTGVGLVLRLLGRRPLTLTVDRSRTTYWQTAPRRPDRSRYLRQF